MTTLIAKFKDVYTKASKLVSKEISDTHELVVFTQAMVCEQVGVKTYRTVAHAILGGALVLDTYRLTKAKKAGRPYRFASFVSGMAYSYGTNVVERAIQIVESSEKSGEEIISQEVDASAVPAEIRAKVNN